MLRPFGRKATESKNPKNPKNPMNGLQDKIALVTGGSRGLGRNIALALAGNGADVILTYRQRKEEGEAVAAEIEQRGRKAALLQIDVADVGRFEGFSRAVQQALETTWQRKNFDFLINNAGIDSAAPFDRMTEENFDRLFLVHFKGVYFLTQKLLPVIADGGAIVCTSTGLARFAIPGYSAYASMKGAIEVFTRYLAKELGPRRIRANAVAPGAIETDFTKGGFEQHPEIKQFLASQTALGRVGKPDDIGGVVAFLCSEEGRWVNAQRLEASGGMFL
jgi:NAD(P)-dependent dehydrogenase (short-subunit alcohol dehydrogenase family)